MAVLLLLLAAAAAGAERLPPIEQCGGDSAFVAFRAQLEETVKRRDSDALLSLLDDKVTVDLGGGAGKEVFAASWSLESPEQSEVWTELERAMGLGCALVGETRVMPSFIAQLDPQADAFDMVIAVVPGAALRRLPVADSEVLAFLQWDVLQPVAWPDQGDFIKVKRGETVGYVRKDQVRTPLDLRLGIERVGGEWKITSFVAGD